MSKTIKFNLILDDKPVRNIEDLRENFSIEDILEVYNNGLLQRWLKVRGYLEILEKVDSIKADKNIDQIYELIDIFGIECDDAKIKEGIEILDYIIERKCLMEGYYKSNYKVKSIINDYHSEYNSIIKDIIDNKHNMPKIKANIKKLKKII